MILRILMRNLPSTRYYSHNLSLIQRFKSTKPIEENDAPIKYSTSKAYKYKASENFHGDENETVPSYNTLVIKGSLVIFLIYFAILRESNDIDEMLSRDLFEIVPELEIPILEADIKRLQMHGVNVDNLKEKLEELKRLEKEKKLELASNNQNNTKSKNE